MENWIALLTNPEKINAIYGGYIPTLNRADLHEIKLENDAARASFRFDLSSYPQNPPAKWVGKQNNRVQIVLSFIDAYDISINGWSENCLMDFNLVKDGDSIKFTGSNELTKISLTASFVYISSLSAYISNS